MAPLSGADLLAVKEYFASSTICGGAPLRLHTETIGKLSAHCETAGIGLDDMRTSARPSDPTREKEWVAEWRALCDEADVKREMLVVRVLAWADAVARPEVPGGGGGRALAGSRAAAALAVLSKQSVVVPSRVVPALEAALDAHATGEEQYESTSIAVRWGLWALDSPGAVAVSYLQEHTHGDGSPKVARIERCTEYKEVRKAGLPTLPACFEDKSGFKWRLYAAEVRRYLTREKMMGALNRFITVCMVPEELFPSDMQRRMKWLWCYFVKEYPGMGLPVAKCDTCNWFASSCDPVAMASAAKEMEPSVPGDSVLALAKAMQESRAAAAEPVAQAGGMAIAQALAGQLGTSSSPFFSSSPPSASPLDMRELVRNELRTLIAGGAGGGAGANEDRILELPAPKWCDFCEAAHDQKHCSKYQQAKKTAKEAARAKQERDRKAAEERKAAAAAAAAAAGD